MIPKQQLTDAAASEGFALDIMVKHYVLGWLLHGILSTSIADRLIFKGGSALSKIHYPNNWRLSEDLDFTASDGEGFGTFGTVLEKELPGIVKGSCGLDIKQKDKPYTKGGFMRTRFSYNGTIGTGTVKIEITTENVIGDTEDKELFKIFDYPDLTVKVYSISTILAEKLRAIIERSYIRDYYDAWRLLETEEFDYGVVRDLFLKKLKLRGTKFKSVNQFFPDGIIEILEAEKGEGLTRLKDEELPTMNEMVEQLRSSLAKIFV